MLLARAGEGSMRDALSAFDQVRAFAGDTIVTEDVVTVLGLVGRDLVFDLLDAVVNEDAPASFALVERAIDAATICDCSPRAGAGDARLLILSVDPGARRIPTSPPTPSGSAERHGRSMVARGSAARVRSADEGGAGSSRFGSAEIQP